MSIVDKILGYTQPVTVIAFLVAGICCLLLRKLYYGVLNLLICVINFVMFYGERWLPK
jgi:hypothetical protein